MDLGSRTLQTSWTVFRQEADGISGEEEDAQVQGKHFSLKIRSFQDGLYNSSSIMAHFMLQKEGGVEKT